MTLGNLSDVHKLVAGDPEFDGDDVQYVFVSVDPQRDSTERLRNFVPYFDSEFIGATGDSEQLDQLTESLGIYHAVTEGGTEQDYLVDHTTSVLLIDPDARLAAIFSAPHDPGAIAEAFSKIRQRRG
jgi:protein SCO1/2